ncbi:MAG TPA: GNAT family protein [Thermotogota bacterium]|nr:GNAT family N-acetyltransferase [Thermotogota bacterium]NLH19868.1 GNAT family N-acetyltransferase [Thermotogaceae bacterium]OQC31896.1 MAG: putative acetyltransferase [Thermotogota bacterium ADurb.Bin062]HNW47171.1 GNAT family protein [Thermotogota bacterium]HNY82285.1 GNAT family protein [Thermotogota bacterium]
MQVRKITEADAAPYLELRCALDSESKTLLLEPGERKTTVDEMRRTIQDILHQPNSMVFLATDEERLVGFLSAIGGKANRHRGTITIVIGILEAYTGRGIGKKLFVEMEKWARGIGAHRLELGLMAHNERALRLYTSLGYQPEGRKRDVFLVDGVYVDELMMGKILETE